MNLKQEILEAIDSALQGKEEWKNEGNVENHASQTLKDYYIGIADGKDQAKKALEESLKNLEGLSEKEIEEILDDN